MRDTSGDQQGKTGNEVQEQKDHEEKLVGTHDDDDRLICSVRWLTEGFDFDGMRAFPRLRFDLENKEREREREGGKKRIGISLVVPSILAR